MTVKLEVKSLYKIFGDQPEKAFKLLAKGHDRASILQKTGQTLGSRMSIWPSTKGRSSW